MPSPLSLTILSLSCAFCLIAPTHGEEKETSLDSLKLPGVAINLVERSVDVQSTVELHEGSLEFVACTKGTKEHESIITVQAAPSHIHTALLLLGAKAGHPAFRKITGEGDEQSWLDVPPEGSPVKVSLVLSDTEGKPTEHPLSDFIIKSDESGQKFPDTHFLFAGSYLTGDDDLPKKYLADSSGSVISLTTFGDELLCLPGVHTHSNEGLQWTVDPTHLPKVGSKIILRLRPGIKIESETPPSSESSESPSIPARSQEDVPASPAESSPADKPDNQDSQ
ncbi:YdjY domain-containing protein [bacterium]|nr:YdjY domain-containing protein [bacterium]